MSSWISTVVQLEEQGRKVGNPCPKDKDSGRYVSLPPRLPPARPFPSGQPASYFVEYGLPRCPLSFWIPSSVISLWRLLLVGSHLLPPAGFFGFIINPIILHLFGFVWLLDSHRWLRKR